MARTADKSALLNFLPTHHLAKKGFSMTSTVTTRIDVRTIVPRERHALIFKTFDMLQPGQMLELSNDHDPRHLHEQFDDRTPGQYEWTYLESGPALWRVQISKTRTRLAATVQDSCCSGGACCG
jgi:uncharacterized protein (DUF2249 family)